MKYIFKVLIFLLTFTSCGTMKVNKTSNFSTINDIKDLEGHYLNHTNNGTILSCFTIRQYADFVSIISESPNEIKLTYYNSDSLAKQERTFTGEMKEKYFEIYFLKEGINIPFIFKNSNTYRIRIGKTKDGKLLIGDYIDDSGYLLFLGAGSSTETSYIFSCAEDYNDYMPTHENGLWGYSDSLGNIVIPKKYDFASIFDESVARVKLNNKWGLVNRQGDEIAPVKYDQISRINTLSAHSVLKANIGEKVGVLDTNGNETIPVIYDRIDLSYLSRYGLLLIQLGDKKGFADRTQVVIPAIYSVLIPHNEKKAVGKRDGKYFIVDLEGYEYEAKISIILGLWSAKPETKRKIQFEEQNME